MYTLTRCVCNYQCKLFILQRKSRSCHELTASGCVVKAGTALHPTTANVLYSALDVCSASFFLQPSSKCFRFVFMMYVGCCEWHENQRGLEVQLIILVDRLNRVISIDFCFHLLQGVPIRLPHRSENLVASLANPVFLQPRARVVRFGTVT